MTVVLHVGTYKTGTSSIQAWLRDADDTGLLARHGARFPHGWLRRDNHLELHLALMRLDRLSMPRWRKDEWRQTQFRHGLLRQITADLDRHPDTTTILSAEDTGLLRYPDELSLLKKLVGDAVVVMYLREPSGFLASYRDQITKWGIEPSADPDSFACCTPDSWQVDYRARFDVWREHFRQVIVMDYDASVATDGSVIPSFARLLGITDDELGDVSGYWLNPRGQRELRVDGNRWTNGFAFGVNPTPAPTTNAVPAAPSSV